MTDATTHVPPQALEAEEWILGAMLVNAQPIRDAEEAGLEAGHFYRQGHRMLFDAIIAVRDAGDEADELTVTSELKRRGQLEAAGGLPYVMTLAERMPTITNARVYADEVVNVATKRRLVEIGHAVAGVGYDAKVSADDSIRQAEAKLLEVVVGTGRKHERGQVLDGDASLDAWSAQYQRYHDDEELWERETLSWGRPELDERLGRMRPGQLFVPAGWTKHGKTWFVLDVAEAAMEQGARVLVDSGEMEDEELVERWVAMGGHDYTAVQEKRLPWSVMADRLRQIKKWQRRTLTGRMSLERLRSQVSRAKLEGRPFRLVVVDHLGLVRPGPGAGRFGRTEFLEDAVAELKAMAVEYGFTLLLVCQLSRPPQEKDTHARYLRPPIQSDLKGASGIEQIATSVIFVYRRMDRQSGKFVEQLSVLLFPFHRSRQTPRALACEFVLPSRPASKSVSAYRFEPVTIEAEPLTVATTEVAAVQESLEGSFGPLTVVAAEPDDIPF
jgi:replicative DNA helicase